MDINKILSADILDIIFEGKNKQYGAYDLRKTYNKRLTKALLLTAAMALLIFLSTVFANAFKKNNADALDVLDTQMAEIKKDVPPPPPLPPPPPPKAPPPPPLNQIKFTPPKVLPDEEVKPEDKPEEIKDDQVISTKTVESDNKEAVVAAPVEDKGTQVAAVPQKDDDEGKIFTKVEVEAGFPGGDAAWGNFLRKNLNVEIPGENGAPEGNHTVVVRFIVSKDGSLSDIQCESDPGYGICQEAIRVIKKTKNWTPAIQNGRNVNAYRRQPITFQVVGQ
jgi:periplasmic protein TonB